MITKLMIEIFQLIYFDTQMYRFTLKTKGS